MGWRVKPQTNKNKEKNQVMTSTMQRIKQGDVIASERVVVLDYGVRKVLCEEGIFELNSE